MTSRGNFVFGIDAFDSTIRVECANSEIRAALDDWADALVRVVKGQSSLEPIFSEVQSVRIGDLCLLGVSGEPFFEIGQSICRATLSQNTWALGYCNAYTGYLPTARAFTEGGYEVSDSFRYLGMWQLAPSSERRVVKAAQRLLIGTHEQ